ncbi:TetR/AcrR family transcriptional regulator [Labrenzia sp. PHM005]|uniref:TetR/AcrR family transcriptional regulator n=1 Tax=Labrenzia sp. PHM005 TaxID=2590016 RepID=UPI00113FEBC5|nr:TetR/AcrR family transcriptional regulator [Labrenzia sp. PHM005]QDG77969.1 TetR/AcrR family transcriptional regulator [Labrenzia sp. PHM005]
MSETADIQKTTTRGQGPGRPREFDEAKALEVALNVFWQKGFEAASLEDLTKAMGLSRSSFYGTFGSKQALFQRALAHYSRNALNNLQAVADTSGEDPVGAMVEALANPQGGSRGCMLINCITELAPHDEEVARIGRQHLESIEEILAKSIDPEHPEAARDSASAYASLAIGTLALRKAGFPAERIAKTLAQAKSVVST